MVLRLGLSKRAENPAAAKMNYHAKRWPQVGDTAAALRLGEVVRCGRPDEAGNFLSCGISLSASVEIDGATDVIFSTYALISRSTCPLLTTRM